MSFETLPIELIDLICSNLTEIRDLVSLSFCSKKLNYVCKKSKCENIQEVYDIVIDNILEPENIKKANNFNPYIKLRLDLSCDFEDLVDLTPFSTLYEINLYGCYRIQDFSSLKYVNKINLSKSSVSDVSELGYVQCLNLTECINVTDVSALGNVHTLNLSDCYNITDVSALVNVNTLNLSCCRNITGVSRLGNVYDLDLSSSNITDVSALGNVHTLNLSYCYNLTDVSALGNVYDLNLSYCTNVTDVSALGNVHTLNLTYCIEITDISMLTNVTNLITTEIPLNFFEDDYNLF